MGTVSVAIAALSTVEDGVLHFGVDALLRTPRWFFRIEREMLELEYVYLARRLIARWDHSKVFVKSINRKLEYLYLGISVVRYDRHQVESITSV